ncbi:hypothetical protein [Thermoflexus sp.]|uniref:hypothetical protein n=1 Tax=Thermoflexus sp. TaxID=1969742 RepID=UPI002ADD33A7|nr:hypothetical protein [Thermoflexus sp.]
MNMETGEEVDDLTAEIRVFLPDTAAALLSVAVVLTMVLAGIGVLVRYVAGTPVCLYGALGFGLFLIVVVWFLSRSDGNATRLDILLTALQVLRGGYEPGAGRIRVGPHGVEVRLEPFPTTGLEVRPWDES